MKMKCDNCKHLRAEDKSEAAREPTEETIFLYDIRMLRALIADDSYAMTFQSIGQYRSAILRALTPNGV